MPAATPALSPAPLAEAGLDGRFRLLIEGVVELGALVALLNEVRPAAG